MKSQLRMEFVTVIMIIKIILLTYCFITKHIVLSKLICIVLLNRHNLTCAFKSLALEGNLQTTRHIHMQRDTEMFTRQHVSNNLYSFFIIEILILSSWLGWNYSDLQLHKERNRYRESKRCKFVSLVRLK